MVSVLYFFRVLEVSRTDVSVVDPTPDLLYTKRKLESPMLCNRQMLKLSIYFHMHSFQRILYKAIMYIAVLLSLVSTGNFFG